MDLMCNYLFPSLIQIYILFSAQICIFSPLLLKEILKWYNGTRFSVISSHICMHFLLGSFFYHYYLVRFTTIPDHKS